MNTSIPPLNSSSANDYQPIPDHRARLERARLEAAERRDQAQLDQRSPHHTPEMRVRSWERLHQVRLPRDPAHPILRYVVEQTNMTLDEVLEVQRQRTLPPSPIA
jgi:hypothetical protein